jgi:hypothetical protein
MSTSGSFQGNDVTIGGNGGNHIFTNWQLASQDVNGNYSTINWQTYFHYNQSDAQLDNGSTNSNVGNLWSNGGRVHNYAGTFTTRDLALSSGSFTIGASNTGASQLQLSNSIAVYQVGSSSATSGVWDLPTIPRYAAIASFTQVPITDEAITINWSADRTCDYISWWSSQIDGGGHHDTPVSGGGVFTVSNHNLKSASVYDFTVAVRNAASGLWTTSGLANATTLGQSGFFNSSGL